MHYVHARLIMLYYSNGVHVDLQTVVSLLLVYCIYNVKRIDHYLAYCIVSSYLNVALSSNSRLVPIFLHSADRQTDRQQRATAMIIGGNTREIR